MQNYATTQENGIALIAFRWKKGPCDIKFIIVESYNLRQLRISI